MTSPPTVLTFGEALVGLRQRRRKPACCDPVHPVCRWCGPQCRRRPHKAWGSHHLDKRLGDDAHGDYLADAIGELGIIPLVRRVSGPTALMFKAGGAGGDPQVLQIRHQAHSQARRSAADRGRPCRWKASHLHLTGIMLGISPVLRAAADTARGGCRGRVSVSFDPNLRPNFWPHRDEMRAIVNTFASHASVVMPGLGEGRLLTGMTIPRQSPRCTWTPAPVRWRSSWAPRAPRPGRPTDKTTQSRAVRRYPGRHRWGRRWLRRRLPRRVPRQRQPAGAS